MYIFPDMIDMGLTKGETFKSDAHKVVASTIGLCNPRVVQRDHLMTIVKAVQEIPLDKIKSVTMG